MENQTIKPDTEIEIEPTEEKKKVKKDKKKKDPKYNNSIEYNANYYLLHREETIKRLITKTECELCCRFVNYQRLPMHRLTGLCINNRVPTITPTN
jgi:hypothetical protein